MPSGTTIAYLQQERRKVIAKVARNALEHELDEGGRSRWNCEIAGQAWTI